MKHKQTLSGDYSCIYRLLSKTVLTVECNFLYIAWLEKVFKQLDHSIDQGIEKIKMQDQKILRSPRLPEAFFQNSDKSRLYNIIRALG